MKENPVLRSWWYGKEKEKEKDIEQIRFFLFFLIAAAIGIISIYYGTVSVVSKNYHKYLPSLIKSEKSYLENPKRDTKIDHDLWYHSTIKKLSDIMEYQLKETWIIDESLMSLYDIEYFLFKSDWLYYISWALSWIKEVTENDVSEKDIFTIIKNINERYSKAQLNTSSKDLIPNTLFKEEIIKYFTK